MIEPARGLGFALEAREDFHRLRFFQLLRAYGLDRHGTLDHGVETFIDDPHRALAEFTPDFVLPEFGQSGHIDSPKARTWDCLQELRADPYAARSDSVSN